MTVVTLPSPSQFDGAPRLNNALNADAPLLFYVELSSFTKSMSRRMMCTMAAPGDPVSAASVVSEQTPECSIKRWPRTGTARR